MGDRAGQSRGCRGARRTPGSHSMELGTADVSPGAPQDEMLQLYRPRRGGPNRAAGVVRRRRHRRRDRRTRRRACPVRGATSASTARERREPSRCSVATRSLRTGAGTRSARCSPTTSGSRTGAEDSAGVGTDRATELAEVRAIAELGRHEHDVRRPRDPRGAPRPRSYSFLGPRHRPEAFHTEVLRIVEIDADGQIVAYVAVRPRRLRRRLRRARCPLPRRRSGAVRGHVVGHRGRAYAALNRHELAADDAGLGEHRPPARRSVRARRHDRIHPCRLGARRRTSRIYIEAVHRLSDLGAVVTHAAHGTSQEGFDAEWRVDQPSDGRRRPDQPLRNIRRDRPRRRAREVRGAQPAGAAAGKRGKPCVRALLDVLRGPRLGRHWRRCWPTTFRSDDRRRVVNAGVRHGRDAEIAEHAGGRRTRGHEHRRRPSSPPAGSASSSARVDAIGSATAARGVRHRGARHHRDRRRRADRRRVVTFDLDDIDAAFEELDARYLAGEAAAHAHTWSVIAEAYAALNRHELPPTTPDWVNVDHRRVAAFAPGDLTAYIHAAWDAHAGHQHLHRGCASAERPRSGRHPCGARDLARGLRRRVAG